MIYIPKKFIKKISKIIKNSIIIYSNKEKLGGKVFMKKILIGVSLGLLAIVGVIGGKIYIDSNKMENIVKSDEVKKSLKIP